ncbi:hypothetical protein D3C81_1074890 [compost metagenome]
MLFLLRRQRGGEAVKFFLMLPGLCGQLASLNLELFQRCFLLGILLCGAIARLLQLGLRFL